MYILQFAAMSTSDEDMQSAVLKARKHYALTNEHCEAICFGVLLWDSRKA